MACTARSGGDLKIVAAMLERPVITKILGHVGLQAQPSLAAGLWRGLGGHAPGRPGAQCM
ncbi:MAG: hypothetical protein U5L05_13395 [Rubrivivax sp.]|nr:hypothetical protein [Rubrivivax sp.]